MARTNDFDKRKISNDWSDVPDTDPNAQPCEYEDVNHVTAIHIQRALIRNAELLGCYFELADPTARPAMKWGADRIEVKCLWYSRKPPTSWMHIAIHSDYEIISNYSGQVVRDIGMNAPNQ